METNLKKKEQQLRMMGGIIAPAQDGLPEETLDEAIMSEQFCISLHGVNRSTLVKQLKLLEKAQEGIKRVIDNNA